MQQTNKQIKIHCRFCNTETGYFEKTDPHAVILNEIETYDQQLQNYREQMQNAMVDTELSDEQRNEIKRTCETDMVKIEEMGVDARARLDATLPWDQNPESKIENYAIEDSRCAACEIMHGSYQDMKSEAMSKGLSPEEVEQILALCDYKKDGFDNALASKLEEKTLARQQPEIELTGESIDEGGCISCQ